MPQYNPWTRTQYDASGRAFGENQFFPRKDAPAFQREWKSLSSSGVLINGSARSAGDLIEIVKAASSVEYVTGAAANGVSSGLYATHYLWGICLACAESNPQGGDIIDADDKKIVTMVATQNGPYFLQLSTPIKITQNSNLRYKVLASNNTDSTYVTPLYTTSYEAPQYTIPQ